MNTQFKKGVLELLVLDIVKDNDMYGYELVQKVSEAVLVNEGTIYPILKRLTNEGCFETYLEESTEGPPRKYYKLTLLGEQRMKELTDSWSSFQSSVNAFMKECEKHESR